MEPERPVVSATPTSSPRVIVRGGEPLRIYRRPAERPLVATGIILITASVAVPVVKSVLRGPVPAAGLPFLGLLLLIPVSLLWWCKRLGVYVSKRGVRNVGIGGTSFTDWSKISGFVVAAYTPLSACVQAQHHDGSMTPLTALSRWVRWMDALAPYCDALNRELALASANQAGESPMPSR
jgi:hypothetical protein